MVLQNRSRQKEQGHSYYLEYKTGACLFNIVWLAGLCLAVLAAALIYYLHRYGELVRLLHLHEKEEKLTYRGSRYSFKDPLIVKIPKVRNI